MRIRDCHFHKRFSLCLAMTLAGSVGFAADNHRSTFLSNGPDSVGGAMGDALVAYGLDATAVYYNPATLVDQPSNVFIEHSKINEDASRSWAALALGDPRLKSSLLWKSDQLPLGSRKDAVLFGVGVDDSIVPWLARIPGLSIGGTVGWISEDIAGDSASSYLANAGALWRKSFGPSDLGIGLSIRNLYFGGLQFSDGGEKERWPRELRTGVSYHYKNLTTVLDAVTVDSHSQPEVGFQYLIGKVLTVRAGYSDTIRLGVGVTIKSAAVAFGYRDGDVQSVPSGSLSYAWGKEEEIDYTNPINELEAQHRSLEAVLISKIHERVTLFQPVEISLPLKTLAVNPANEEAWTLLYSKEDIKKFKVKIPTRKQPRRQYLEFAVAYANDKPEAKEYAHRFVDKNKKASISKLVNMILELDLDKPVATKAPVVKPKKRKSNTTAPKNGTTKQ